MTLALNLTAKICILMLIGFVGRKAGLFDDVCKEKLSNILVNLLLPVNMLVSSQQVFKMSLLKGVGMVALIAIIYYVVALTLGNLLGRFFRYEQKKSAVFTLLITFANTGFLGMPFLAQVLGDTGVLYGAVYNCVFDLLYFSYGIYIIGGKESNGSGKKGLLSNPLIWVAVATVIIYVLPFRAPEVVTDTLGCLADAMLPVSMLIIGAEIAGIHFKSIVTDKSSYVASLLRMVLIPAVTLILMKLTGVTYEIAATTIMQNTILMIITLPFITYICEVWL